MLKSSLKRTTALLAVAGLVPLAPAHAQSRSCSKSGESEDKRLTWGVTRYAKGKSPLGANYPFRYFFSMKPASMTPKNHSHFYPDSYYAKLVIEYGARENGTVDRVGSAVRASLNSGPFGARESKFEAYKTSKYSNPLEYFTVHFTIGEATGSTRKPSVNNYFEGRRLSVPRSVFEIKNIIADTDQMIEAKYNLFAVKMGGKVVYQTPFTGVAKYDIKELDSLFSQAVEATKKLKEEEAKGFCKPVDPSAPAPVRACFLTTAACETVGLEDDCWELTQMRSFRDKWLAHQDGGPEAIARYYEYAPAIVDELSKSPKKLLSLYWTRIVPCALARQVGANRLANRLYTRMVRELGVPV